MHLIKKCGLSMILALCLLFTGCNSITQIDPSEEPITQSDLSEEQKIQKIEKGMTRREVQDILGKRSFDCMSGANYPLSFGWQIHEKCVVKITFKIDGCDDVSEFYEKIDEFRAQSDFSVPDWFLDNFKASYAVVVRGTGDSEKTEVLFE